MQYISPFSLPELEIALKGITNLSNADKEGIVVEMIKHADVSFKQLLLKFQSQTCIDDYV